MKWFKDYLLINFDIQSEIFYSVFIISMILLLRWVIIKFINNNVEDVVLRYRWRKIFTYASFILAIILLLPVWLKGFRSLMTFLGLFSAGLAIALRDLVSNLVGWFFIIWRRPFVVGDRIQIGDVAGDIIDIRIFTFSMMEIGNWVDADQSTGRVIHVPNSKVLTNTIANFTTGFEYIWNEIPVLITFESDWEKAKKILLDIAYHHTAHLSEPVRQRINEAAQKFMIICWKNLTPYVFTRVTESGILLTIRYLCEPHKRRNSEELIWEDVLREFAKYDTIEFAYPTYRFYSKEFKSMLSEKDIQQYEKE
nr:mechanosensitive ion channel domain-containing protein [Anoxybacter fermentans]